jgi:formylglycine-generating enzyme required for sulfatase activity
MSAEGRDELGRWAELRVNGVVQRLRWIEPGEFWMGSTEAERKRFVAQLKDDQKTYFDDEAPRHRVKLTRGFWLADTACTQALWQTVTGDNPSHFTGDPNLPVEQVSWDDVTQKFLLALNRQLTGVAAVLPTEAQWEYACRAGTETAYHFGEQIHTDQVNYDGNYPPPGGRKGEYRERTVPVKALPANAWGLYQMHGNVWEWCADARRTYGVALEVDPDGGQDGVGRVLRGGAWFIGAGRARSACRIDDGRDFRHQRFGFRFALRSIEPGAGGQ